ncbi:tetratricopeptide repeat protein [Dictyobacter aurantiacus]|uniref:MalT-like TPR region domain-containing protein n=1 Tax=Dictyobacter aurantiacus TaxID=1936993 RepID=A0A401Z8A5_9CHLR|nr:tetratricopeptide repeat protein [Dictyobacter aurantiacus]GCE03097.1 hypothetical protein KDAU_04260 [Dictyobacter aurantiacus]
MEIHIQVVGEEQPELIDPLEHLARAYSAQEEYVRAQQYLLQALAIYQEAGRPEDMLLDSVLNSLAEIEIARGHPALARNYLDRSRAIRELTLGQNNPRTIEVAQKLASISTSQMTR